MGIHCTKQIQEWGTRLHPKNDVRLENEVRKAHVITQRKYFPSLIYIIYYCIYMSVCVGVCVCQALSSIDQAKESMMKKMGGPASSIDSSQMKENMKRIGEMSPDELKTMLV